MTVTSWRSASARASAHPRISGPVTRLPASPLTTTRMRMCASSSGFRSHVDVLTARAHQPWPASDGWGRTHRHGRRAASAAHQPGGQDPPDQQHRVAPCRGEDDAQHEQIGGPGHHAHAQHVEARRDARTGQRRAHRRRHPEERQRRDRAGPTSPHMRWTAPCSAWRCSSIT